MDTISGKFLDGYKDWYLRLPKIVRIAVLPGFVAILGAWLQIFDIDKEIKGYWGLGLLALLGISAYNQLIEVDTKDEYLEAAEYFEAEKEFWKQKYGDASFLSKLFSEMVLRKSEMWRKAALMSTDKGIEAARQFIREENALRSNIDRIIALVYEAFKRHMDAATHESVRIAYFVPNETNEQLVLRSWCNGEIKAPYSTGTHKEAFSRNGASLASFVWTRKSQEHLYFLDDVEAYCQKNHDEEGVFSYLNNGQKSSIKSIFCYRIVDGLEGNCLGIMCVDCNAVNMFQGQISEDVCKDIVLSAGSRIVYETRFSMMKSALGPYDGVSNHVGK